MEIPQRDLRTLGQIVAGTFKRLIESQWVDGSDASVPSKRRIAAEEERFRLWARTLGLFQTGHASLDYRVRDATFVKTSLRDLVMELQDHLQNLLEIVLGTRLPLEQDEEACRTGEETTSDDEDSLASSLSSSGSFQEAEFRLSSVTSRLDSLYKLASRIRSPRNRPQRPMADLCKHIPEAQRTEYIHNQEHIEVSLLEYVQRQHLLETFGDEELQELGLSQEELFVQYASASHWLITRMGRANARRKQQFLYWKKHAQNLGHNVEEEPAAPELHNHPAATSHPGAQKNVERQAHAKSMATSATKLDQNMMGPSDKKSVISTRSRTSTVVTPQGEMLAWPPAPTYPANIKYFPCPYCGILCPEDYLERDNWLAHQIHDLQPYLCTYQDCFDPGRLYGNKQEWIDHENQHRRVWHCHKHEAEFQTLPEYLHHIGEKHPDTESEECMPEMTAAVVGASSEPHRDCPLCPTAFNDVVHMRKHMRYHLERLALYVLPDAEEDAEDQLAAESPSDSHQVIENRGRQGSVANDFGEKLEAFLAGFEEEEGKIAPHEILRGDGPGLTRASLDQAQPSSNTSWLDTYWAIQQDWLVDFESTGQTASSYLEEEEDELQTRLVDAGAAAVEASKAIDSKTPTSSDGEADSDPPPDHLLYQVAWICTSETETSAVELILDEKHSSFSHVGGDDKMMFCLGRVAQHRVVVAYFLDWNPYLKDTSATHLLRVFPNVRIAVLVGVGGYAPSPQHDVRLGDIVTGGLGITEPELEDESSLQGPPVFRDAAHALAERHPSYSGQRHGSQIYLEHILSRLTSRYRKKYSRPPAASDRLYRSDFAHPDPRQSCGVVCDDLSQLMPRESRGHDRPVIHYGAIDSSAGPIFDAVYRDGLATTRSVVCFKPDELDLRATPCLVICGVCDYANSHRNWEWRDHAGMLAAAYASDLLSFIPQHTLDDMEPIGDLQQASNSGVASVSQSSAPAPKQEETRDLQARMQTVNQPKSGFGGVSGVTKLLCVCVPLIN